MYWLYFKQTCLIFPAKGGKNKCQTKFVPPPNISQSACLLQFICCFTCLCKCTMFPLALLGTLYTYTVNRDGRGSCIWCRKCRFLGGCIHFSEFTDICIKIWLMNFASRANCCARLIRKIMSLVVFTKSLCHVIEVMCGPLMQTFENRLERNERKTEELLREKEELERRLEAIRNA